MLHVSAVSCDLKWGCFVYPPSRNCLQLLQKPGGKVYQPSIANWLESLLEAQMLIIQIAIQYLVLYPICSTRLSQQLFVLISSRGGVEKLMAAGVWQYLRCFKRYLHL